MNGDPVRVPPSAGDGGNNALSLPLGGDAAWDVPQDEAQVTSALARAGRELLTAVATPMVLEHLCRIVGESLRCSASTAVVLRDGGEHYVPVADWRPDADQRPPDQTVTPSQNELTALADRLAHEQVVEVDLADEPSTQLTVAAAPAATAIALCTALRSRDKVVGVQLAARSGPPAAFSAADRRIAQGIAELASIALERARAFEALESANRLKSDFVATMSHELRAPLTIVIGYTDLLLEGDFEPLSVEQRDAIARAYRAAETLSELVTHTLNLSRLERNALTIAWSKVEVGKLITDLNAETADLQEGRPFSFAWHVEPGLPALVTDPAWLKLVLRNLIANAVKFTEAGTIEIRAGASGDGVEFIVADTGIGIPADFLPVIFEPFRQVETASRSTYVGTGLGLYIARRLLELIGGTIEVTSTPGRGSAFRVWLPRSARPT